jgi:hypothetical protein
MLKELRVPLHHAGHQRLAERVIHRNELEQRVVGASRRSRARSESACAGRRRGGACPRACRPSGCSPRRRRVEEVGVDAVTLDDVRDPAGEPGAPGLDADVRFWRRVFMGDRLSRRERVATATAVFCTQNRASSCPGPGGSRGFLVRWRRSPRCCPMAGSGRRFSTLPRYFLPRARFPERRLDFRWSRFDFSSRRWRFPRRAGHFEPSTPTAEK